MYYFLNVWIPTVKHIRQRFSGILVVQSQKTTYLESLRNKPETNMPDLKIATKVTLQTTGITLVISM